MKNLTFGILLFLLTNSVLAQPFHEIKLNAFGFVMDQFGISYEYVIKKNFGLEFGLGYNYEPQTLILNNNISPIQFPVSESFIKNYWIVMLHSKFYPGKSANGNRFNLGGYFHFQSKPKIESTYFIAYEQQNNEPLPFSFKAIYKLGGFAGYKLMVLKQRFLIEPVYGIGASLSNSKIEITGLLQLNMGYRF